MSILTRKKSECATHEWSTITAAGLRRSICTVCGEITIEAVSFDLTLPESLQKMATGAR
ncbi:MAG: hypothetical protein ACLGHX_01580 [Acidimicrobiia bacterium]